METFLEQLSTVLQKTPQTTKEALDLLIQSENKAVIKDQIIKLLGTLDLEDLFDILDLIFEHDQIMYQTELFELVISYIHKQKQEYQQLANEVPQHEKEAILNESDFTSADCASVCNFLVESFKLNLTQQSIELILSHCKQFFLEPQEAVMSFYFNLAHQLIVRLHLTQPDRCMELVLLVYPFALKSSDFNSSVILFCVSCFSLQLPTAIYEEILATLVKIAERSRDHLVAIVAAYNQLTIEMKVPLNKEFGHRFMGQNKKISTGLMKLITEMNSQVEIHDPAPQLLAQFLIIQAKSDHRVAKLIGLSDSFKNWLQELSESKSEEWKQLSVQLGKIVLKSGHGDNEEWGAAIMKIISGSGAKAPSVDLYGGIM
ncbi:Conserved_hypothetical protein [Hexamita inflata]|uniref:Uncharacterized protein n=1 Tax=Hexamita inflata TaxID=28002 RepID=A0AA86VMF5_9EUKA|nr:Conserved hypothetical protein [Hexamita inflata]